MDKPHTEFPVFIVMRNGFIMPPGLHMNRANAEATAAREEGEVVPLFPPNPPAEWMDAASEINDAIDAAIGRDESGITDEAIAAIIAKHYSAPAEGWQMVPREPTDEMLNVSVWQPMEVKGSETQTIRWHLWEAMLAAAPKVGK